MKRSRGGTPVGLVGQSLAHSQYSITPNPNHMKASTRNKAAGTANIVKGDAKVVVGKVMGNRLLQAKGRAQELIGKIQKNVGSRQKSEGN